MSAASKRFIWPLLFAATATAALPVQAQLPQLPPGPGSGIGFANLPSVVVTGASIAAPTPLSPGGARTITTSRIPESQLRELLSDVTSELKIARGMRLLDAGPRTGVPEWVQGLVGMGVADSSTPSLRFGYIMVPRRLPQLWVDGSALPVFEDALRLVLEERGQARSKLRLRELGTELISLSYIDVGDALFALRAMGYLAITEDDASLIGDASSLEPAEVPSMTPNQTPAQSSVAVVQLAPNNFSSYPALSQGANAAKTRLLNNLPKSISMDKLPVIIQMPNPEKKQVGLVGANDSVSSSIQRDQLGITNILPNAASDLAPTVSNDTDFLLVLYHPDYPEQVQRLRDVIASSIDRPARQVYIEGLVLEINSDAVRDLGIQWSARRGEQSLTLGSAVPIVNGSPALTFTRDSLAMVSPTEILNRINALVEQNKAEVLSRPSVMTLDNRQATIRVGTDIPVATSIDAGGSNGGGRVSFSFQYIPTGILLNVRPRVNTDGTEVSMLIDATVSATVPNQDLKVVDPVTKATLVSAPTISTRRVQTYARIRDNVPLIIGGLVSRSNSSTSDKVPGIGELPVLGNFFGHSNRQDNRREVIVVLTPSVVNESSLTPKAQTLKDDARLDLTDTALLREQYRIQQGDIPDVKQTLSNQRLQAYRGLVKELARRDAATARLEPFISFADERVPAEAIVVEGLLHRLLARLPASTPPIGLQQMMLAGNLRLPTGQPQTLANLLASMGDGKNPQSFFDRQRGKALALTFRPNTPSGNEPDKLVGQAAEIRLVDSANRDSWRRQLWELNQPEQGPGTGLGQKRVTLLIQDPSDIDRIRQAIMLKTTLEANGNVSRRTLAEFQAGRMVNVQKPMPNWEQLLDASVAYRFFVGEHHYPYFVQEHERQLKALDDALRQPTVRAQLGNAALP